MSEKPTLIEAYRLVRVLIDAEYEAGVEGNAYLDPPQLDALEEVLALVKDVLRDAGKLT